MEKRPSQRIRFLRTSDGVQLAWAEAGAGPPLVKASNWLSHLEFEWESPVWRHWIRFFSDHFRFVRYDERGCGMSDWNVDDFSFARWVGDLEAVADAALPQGAFPLLGISQGAATAVAYAVKHPERVSRLVLYGGYARGWGVRGDSAGKREHEAIVDLAALGWGRDNPAFRQVFTSRFIPGATSEQMDWFNELCKRTSAPAIAAELLRSRANVDVKDLLPKVSAPTLVIHAREDAAVPVSAGRQLAALIPGAEFVELDSKNHILLEGEPAWERFCGAVRDFTGIEHVQRGEERAFASLTLRERGILALLTEGLSNADIAERLGLSEKTVRNHVSNLFDKLGVWTRAQAIVFARDRGFRT
ncbi:MAG TPA: alpha/beta fold hydrolase [Thermoanaerobaculia bacterium]|nr:alpha/beta fold hydrolase [Thermoanaerobaculia bacterium]